MPEHNSCQSVIQKFIDVNGAENGALLPLLHAIQDKFGYIPKSAVTPISKALSLSEAEVHGVITYYHYFRYDAPGRHIVQICRAESCQACGSDELLAVAQDILGCSLHQKSRSGLITLEPVYCLGLCASSPAIQVDNKLHARVSIETLKGVLVDLEASA